MSKTITMPDGSTEEVDYGKSTLFRFSVINKPELKPTKPSTTFPTIKFPREAYEFGASAGSLNSLSDLLTFNKELFHFSEWLASDSFHLDFEQVNEALNGVSTVSGENEDLIWDSLYKLYNTQSQNSISKNLINLLRGNEFAIAFNDLTTTNPELTDFPSDEVSEEFAYIRKTPIGVIEELIPELEPIQTPPTSLFSPDQQNALKRKQNAAIAHYRINTLSQFSSIFQEVKSEYSFEKDKAYREAIDEHTNQVNQLLENRELIQSLSEKPARDIEELELPEFNFEFLPFDTEYIKSKECYQHIGEAIENLAEATEFCGNLDKLENYLEKQINVNQEQFNNNVGLNLPLRAYFNDQEIVYNPSPANNSYVIQAVKLFPDHEKYSIIFTHFSKNGATKIGRISGEAVLNGENTIPLSLSRKIRETKEYTSFIVSEEDIEFLENDEININGEAFAENGEFNLPFNVLLKKDTFVFGPQMLLGTEPMLLSMGNGEPGIGDKPMYGIRKVGIKDYIRVEQEICCYVPGEVSHIENVMAREFRKKLVRDLERQEITTEESEETEHEKTTDNTTTERFELQKEISQMLTKEQSKQIGITAGMNASYSAPSFNLGVNAGTNLNFSNSSSQTNGFNQSESIAKEVVQKATERVTRKIAYKRTARMLREHEETNEHGFDNRKGDKHVTGIYRWVDKVYKNTLYNYGKRLQYDFMLPEPAKNFKYWMTHGDDDNSNQQLQAPMYPGAFVDKEEGFNWHDITEQNYAKIAAEYGADVEPMPEKILRIAKSFSENPQGKFPDAKPKWDEPRDSFNYEIEIPDDYCCKGYWGSINHVVGHPGKNVKAQAEISIDTSTFFYSKSQNSNTSYMTFINGNYNMYVTKALPIGVSTINLGGFSINVVSDCHLTENAKNAWKQRTYTAIMNAYYKKLQAYKDAKAAITPEKKDEFPDYNNNPGKNRAIEARELKRLAIETMCFQLQIDYSREGYLDTTSCDNSYRLYFSADSNKHANLINFLEQAFEWDLISYQFYPYMYADRPLWESLIKQKSSSDPLFEAFLQSGMARLTLTVTPGFEKLVMFFLDTGIVPVSDDFVPGGQEDWYRSIADMLKVKEKEPIGEPWETRVPTDLVILQADAAPLQQTGLPCVCEDGTEVSGIAIGQSQMSGNASTDYSGLIGNIKDALIELAEKIAMLSGDDEDDRDPPIPNTCEVYNNTFSNYYQEAQNIVNNYDALEGQEREDARPQTLLDLQALETNMTNTRNDAQNEGCFVGEMDTQLAWLSDKIVDIQNENE